MELTTKNHEYEDIFDKYLIDYYDKIFDSDYVEETCSKLNEINQTKSQNTVG